MEIWEAITSRRNVRSYADRPVPGEQLEQILEAGRRAPSSRNWQPWDFVLVTDRDQLARLAKVWRGAGHVARSAATIAMVGSASLTDHERGLLNYDLGQATMAMMLAAVEFGIGSGHSAVRDQELARDALGLPDDRFCAFLLALGYPADRPLRPIKRPNRRPYDDVVHIGRW